MTGTITRGKVLRGDLAHWDGRTNEATRKDASGGTITGLVVDNDIDVVQVFGSGTAFNSASLARAVEYVGTNPVTFVLAPGVWAISASVTVPATVAVRIPSGVDLQISSGITLTFNGPVYADQSGFYSGSGSLVLGADSIVAGQVWYKRTDAEATASVVPSDYSYLAYDFPRYGPTIDGVANDGTAVRNWVLSAAAAGAVATSSIKGTALCSSFTAIDTTNPVRISAPGLTLKGPASATDFCRPGGIVECDGVTFDRWGSVFERELADTGSITRFLIKRNRFVNCTGLVINIERPISKYRIEDNDFDTCSGGYAIKIGENTYANQDNWLRGWVKDNDFSTISASGTTSAAAMLIYGKWVSITGNTINGVAQSGTGEAWGIYTKVRYGNISGNKINNVVASGNADNIGINVKGATRLVTSSPQGYAITVTGNTVTNVGSAGVRGGAIRAQSDDILISDNICEDTGLGGIGTDNSAGFYAGNRISDNLIRFESVAAGTVGISLSGQGTGPVADNNTIINAAAGVYTYSVTGDLDDAQVTRNQIIDCTVGLFFDASNGTTLERLIMDDNVIRGATTGILNNGSAGTVTGIRLRRNDVDAGTAFSGSLGTNLEAYGNIGLFRGSATYDPGSLNDAAGVTTTVTVTGAALGDYAYASFSLDLQGITLTAWVSASDTVSVRFQNESGGVLDLNSGTLRAYIEKRP